MKELSAVKKRKIGINFSFETDMTITTFLPLNVIFKLKDKKYSPKRFTFNIVSFALAFFIVLVTISRIVSM